MSPSPAAGTIVKKTSILLLLAIVAAGAALRFSNISEVEPFLADEAAYVLEARYIYSLLSAARESIRLKLQEKRTGQDLWKKEREKKRFTEDLEGKTPWYGRPGHLYLVCIAMAIAGPEKVYPGALVSAFFGTLCILLVFLLGQRLYGTGAGLIAAALFALSAVEVLYSRSFLTEEDSLFFFLLAVLCYLSNRKAPAERKWGSVAMCGLLLGVSFVVHYRMITYIFALWLLEVPFWLTKDLQALRYATLRSLVLGVGLLTPIGLTELPYYAAMLFAHFALKTTLPFTTYVEQLVGQFLYLVSTYADSPVTGVAAVNFLTYPFLLWTLEGAAVTIALLAGMIGFFVGLAKRRGLNEYLPAALFLVPWLSCTLFNPRTRYLSGFLPFGIVMAAACLQRFLQHAFSSRGRLGGWLLAAGLAAILVRGGTHALRAAEPKVSYGQAIAFIHERGPKAHLATFPLISQVYSGVKNVPDLWPASEEELREVYAQGHRYLVVDFVKDVIDVVVGQFNLDKKGEKFAAFRRRVDLIDRIESTLSPVYTCPNRHIGKLYNLFEVNQNFTRTIEYARQIRSSARATTIRVYDLEAYFRLGQ